MKILRKHLKKYWLLALLASGFMVAEVYVDLYQPRMMQRIVDEGILGVNSGGVSNLDLVISTGIRMLLIVLAGGLCGIGSGLFTNLTGQNYGNDIRKACFEKVMHLSFEQTDRFSTGSLITRITNDVTQLQQLVMQMIRGLVRCLMFFIGGTAALLSLDLSFGVIVACAFPLILIDIIFVVWRTSPLFTVLQESLDRLNGIIQENVAGIRVVKAFVQEKREAERFDEANRHLVDTQFNVQVMMSFLRPVMNIVLNIAVVGILYVGSVQVRQGDVAPNFKNDLKYTIMNNPGVFFENLGMTYLGPIDGHDIKQIITALNKARSLDEPVVIHCLTKKGKGYSIAEKYPRKFHGIGPFDPGTGEVIKKSSNPSFSKVMGKHLIEMARKDEKIVAITAAMGEATGLMDISLEIPERYFDVGIAEEHGVTFAAGLAKAGLKPMVCIYSSFLQRAYDQLMEDVCLQNLHVVFLLDRAGVVGADGETHHGIFDLSYLNTMPNMTVLAPKNGEELEKMMDWAAEQDGPVAIRYPRGEAICDNDIMSTKYDAPGSFRVFSGKEIDIWTLGKMYDTAHEVRKILESKGYRCGLVDVNMAKPLDVSVYDSNSRYVISIEDNIVTGGFGDILCKALMDRNCKVIRFGWPDTFVTHGTFEQLADMYGLSPEKIADSILKHIAADKKRGGLFG